MNQYIIPNSDLKAECRELTFDQFTALSKFTPNLIEAIRHQSEDGDTIEIEKLFNVIQSAGPISEFFSIVALTDKDEYWTPDVAVKNKPLFGRLPMSLIVGDENGEVKPAGLLADFFEINKGWGKPLIDLIVSSIWGNAIAVGQLFADIITQNGNSETTSATESSEQTQSSNTADSNEKQASSTDSQ